MSGGYVTLVGAGPGPGLITVKGLSAVRQAEVLVYDDLIDSELLSQAPADCERLYVGKRSGRHSESQENINRLLIEKAAAGKAVVRLKGGDPFVFGRGGEEILALREAGIPWEVVPGVTSAVAVPEELGIPVTHRGLARSFTVVTGHSADGSGEDYGALAKLRGTLVFLMGLSRIGAIAERLIACGKDPATPASILSRGFTPEQTRIDGALGDIADRAAEARTPAILVVGRTAGFDLAGTLRRPLDGVRVTVTGTDRFTRKLEKPLADLGAEVRRLPLLEILPEPDLIPRDLSGYTWLVFTSSNGIDVFFRCLLERSTDLRRLGHLNMACVGPGTADRLRETGFLADFVPRAYSAEALGKELAAILTKEDRLLLLRAKEGSAALPDALRAAGASFDDVPVYTTRETACPDPDETCADYVVFSSGSGVDAFFRPGRSLGRAKPVCIGAHTRQRLTAYTAASALVPDSHSAEAITKTILEDMTHETISQIPAE